MIFYVGLLTLFISIFCVLGPCLFTTQHLLMIIKLYLSQDSTKGSYLHLLLLCFHTLLPVILASPGTEKFALEIYAAYLRAVKERINHISPIHSVTMTKFLFVKQVWSRWGPKRAPNISFFMLNCWDVPLNIFSVKKHDGYVRGSMKISDTRCSVH
jgi:uncharacterized protein with PQ loop repeat